jgi:hypothetical protein
MSLAFVRFQVQVRLVLFPVVGPSYSMQGSEAPNERHQLVHPDRPRAAGSANLTREGTMQLGLKDVSRCWPLVSWIV